MEIPDDFPQKIKATLEKVKNSDRNTPLKRLLNSQVTPDGRFMLMGGQIIDMKTGRERPVFENHGLKFQPMEFPYFGNNKKINEEWSWGESSLNPSNWTVSGVLHGVADVASVAADWVVPGSGALIDAANAISYVIEAEFADSEEEKNNLYIMAALTFAFIFIPYIPAGPVKSWIKSGGKVVSNSILQILKAVWMILDGLLLKIPSYVVKVLKNPTVTKVLGNNAGKASGAITRFTSKIKTIFTNFLQKRGVKLGAPISKPVTAATKATTKEGAEKVAQKMDWNTFTDKFKVADVYSSSAYLPKVINSLLDNLKNVIPSKTAFDPSKIQILKKANMEFAGDAGEKLTREVLEIKLPNGAKTIIYKSSGANVKTTGKEAGEWFVIPGFAQNGWLIKTADSVAITKGGNEYLTSLAKHLQKNGAESLGTIAKSGASKIAKEAVKKGASKAASAFAKKLPAFKNGPALMTKFGFKQGKTYKYVLNIGGKTTVGKATINKISSSGVEVAIKYSSGKTVTRVESVQTFMLRAVVSPFQKIARFSGGAALVPLFVKRFVDAIQDDGTVDEEALMKMEDLNPDVVAQESDALGTEIAQYEGDSGSYNVSEIVDSVQTALGTIDNKYKNLLSDNGRLEDPYDGKFGPLTRNALKSFQVDNKIEETGKMDLRTVKAIVSKLGGMKTSPELVAKIQQMMPKDQSNLALDLLNQLGTQEPAKPAKDAKTGGGFEPVGLGEK
jgi:peptidoglycan hydrolase-like protein with peptidoglycan-binding domain